MNEQCYALHQLSPAIFLHLIGLYHGSLASRSGVYLTHFASRTLSRWTYVRARAFTYLSSLLGSVASWYFVICHGFAETFHHWRNPWFISEKWINFEEVAIKLSDN